MKILKNLEIKPVYRYFALYFMPIFIILITSLLLLVWIQVINVEKSLLKEEKLHVKLIKKIANSNLKSIFSDLQILANYPELQDMLDDDSSTSRKVLEDAYIHFCKSKGLYDQIRFLDSKGMEKIRINYYDGKPALVQKEFLQNKFKRYYFKDTYKLPKGKIFVSPFDLNIEKGEIEKPLKPMIRFGIPVFDKNNKKRGIVLLNYLGDLMIFDLLSIYQNQPGVLMLLNSQGYWLKGEKSEDEWAFMYAERKNITFNKKYPAAWKRIGKNDFGQLKTRYGMFTYHTIKPLKSDSLSSDGAWEAYKQSKKVIKHDEYKWKIVTFVSKEKIFQLKKNVYYVWIPPFFVVIIIQLFISWFLAKSKITKIRNEELIHKSLEEKELLLKEIHHRVKNSLNLVYNILNLQLYESDDPKVEKIIQDIQSRVLSIGTIHDKLYKSKDLINIDFGEYIKDLFGMLQETINSNLKKISINYNLDFVEFHADKTIQLGIIFAEFFINALKYAYSEREIGEMSISLKTIDDSYEIVFSDNGKGLPEGFSIEDSESFGFKLVKILVEQLKGEIEYKFDNGSVFIITFPK